MWGLESLLARPDAIACSTQLAPLGGALDKMSDRGSLHMALHAHGYPCLFVRVLIEELGIIGDETRGMLCGVGDDVVVGIGS